MLGKNVTRCREMLRMTKAEFAQMAGISTAFLRNVENGDNNLGYEKLLNIVERSGYPIDYFIGEGSRMGEELSITVFMELISNYNTKEVNLALSELFNTASE